MRVHHAFLPPLAIRNQPQGPRHNLGHLDGVDMGRQVVNVQVVVAHESNQGLNATQK